MQSFLFISTRLSVCFLSSFPASLPTAVPLVLAFWSPSGVLLGFCILSFALALGSDYLAFRSSFPFIPASPHVGSFRCSFIRFPRRLFPYARFRFGTQLSCDPLPGIIILHHRCSNNSRPNVLQPSAVPLAFALGSVFGQSDTP